MGESYYRPGVQCDVGTIEAAGGDTWKAFCDCNFLAPLDIEKYSIDGRPVILPVRHMGMSDVQYETLRNNALRAATGGDMRRLRVEVEHKLVPGPEWDKCMSKHCMWATGCWNGSKNGWDPFNVHPGILAAPWTEFGAAARGIQKADAGIWYGVAQFISIDLNDYTPLALWQTFWRNPFKYSYLMLKLALFVPGGAVIVAAVNVTGPPVALIPLASAQVAAQGKNYFKEIIEPTATGSVKWLLAAADYLGSCGVGVNIPCGAGILVQKAAQDQIDTKEIERMPAPFRAVTVFLAKNGKRLVNTLIQSVGGVVSTDVFAILKSGFAIARAEVTDQGTKDVLRALEMAADVGYTIADAVVSGKSPADTADRIAQILLGFSPLTYFEMVKTDAKAALGYVAAAQKVSGTTFDQANALVKAVGDGINKVGQTINALNTALGGGLRELAQVFESAGYALGVTASASQEVNTKVQASVQAGGVPVAAVPNVAPVSPGATPSTAKVGGGARPGPGTMPIGGELRQTSSAASALVGAGVGAAFGGPLGAFIGAGVGLAVTPKTLVRVKSTLPTVPGLVKRDTSKVTKTVGASGSTAIANMQLLKR